VRTDPFSDAWLFLLGAQPDQTALGAWRWAFVALFAVLLVGGVAIAVARLAAEPEQRSGHHLAFGTLRILIGTMWFQGMLWKLPLFSPDNGLYFWTKEMATNAAFPFISELVQNVLLPNFDALNPVVFLAELGFATSLMLGLGVRAAGAFGLLFVLNLWLGLYRHPQEWPWTYVFLGSLMAVFSVEAAGRSLGLDGWLRDRFPPEMTNGPLGAFTRYLA
jgi:hypothetical protein